MLHFLGLNSHFLFCCFKWDVSLSLKPSAVSFAIRFSVLQACLEMVVTCYESTESRKTMSGATLISTIFIASLKVVFKRPLILLNCSHVTGFREKVLLYVRYF